MSSFGPPVPPEAPPAPPGSTGGEPVRISGVACVCRKCEHAFLVDVADALMLGWCPFCGANFSHPDVGDVPEKVM